jgi:predicted DNA-binding transcriptional regulator AlpA
MNENPSLRGLMRTESAAQYVGLAMRSFYTLVSTGKAPPPRLRIGNVCFWHKEDLDFFRATYVGRPGARHINKRQRGRAFC